MVFLEAFPVLDRRDYCFFHRTAGDRIHYGSRILFCSLSADHHNDRAKGVVRGSDIGLAIACLHYFTDQRRTTVLPWNCGAILI